MDENTFEKRKEKVIGWLMNNYNLIFIGILILAFVLRLYYFFITLNQPLWWDEAEYASKAISYVKGTPSTIGLEREIILPLFWAFLYKLYPGEFLWRLFQFAMSFAFVVIIYLTAKSIFNKKIALITGLFASTSMLLLFYTGRLLVYMWGGLLVTLTIFLFYEGYVNKKGIKWIYASAITLSVGTLIYYSTFLAVAIIFIFLLLTEGFSFIKKKEIYKPALVSVAILCAYFIFSYIKFGFLHPRLYQVVELAARATNWANWKGHFPLFPHLFGFWWIIAIIIGLIVTLKLLLVIDIIVLKKKSTKEEKGLLITALWFWFVMLFFLYMAVFGRTAVYEGFILPVYPAVGMLAAVGIMATFNMVKKHISKTIAIIGIIILLLFITYTQVTYSDRVIKNSLYSFAELRPAGTWIKENSDPSDIIYTYSHPQINYYSERLTIPFDRRDAFQITEENIAQVMIKQKVRYLVWSPYDGMPQWIIQFAQENPEFLTQVHVVPSVRNPQQGFLGVFEVHAESYPLSKGLERIEIKEDGANLDNETVN